MKDTLVFMKSARYFCLMLNKFGISRQIFVGFVKVKFHENPFSRIRADICGETERRMHEQTDGRTGAFFGICEGTKGFTLFHRICI
jgi:hypothetical protein